MSRVQEKRGRADAGGVGAPPRHWSPSRIATGLLLGAWAGMFWFLWLSGRSTLYLGFRTLWIIPIGAATLTLTAAGRLLTARVPQPHPLRGREALVIGLMVMPVMAIAVLPPTALGQTALKGRPSFAQAALSMTSQSIGTGPLNWIDIASSPLTELGARALEQREGSTVTLIGFVTIYPDTSVDEFYLTRFVITCCVLDATIAQVRVVNVTPGKYKSNEWVSVTGTMYPIGRDVIIDESSIKPVPRPADPYLTPK